ncbi:MAG: hypothetical protein RLZ37_1309 [Actinomycetota bacterium]|jgi:hypothetical protein
MSLPSSGSMTARSKLVTISTLGGSDNRDSPRTSEDVPGLVLGEVFELDMNSRYRRPPDTGDSRYIGLSVPVIAGTGALWQSSTSWST